MDVYQVLWPTAMVYGLKWQKLQLLEKDENAAVLCALLSMRLPWYNCKRAQRTNDRDLDQEHARHKAKYGLHLYMIVSQSWAMLSVPSLRSPVIVRLISNPDSAKPFSTTTLPLGSRICPLLVVRVPANTS